jgi:hypothetical protein
MKFKFSFEMLAAIYKRKSIVQPDPFDLIRFLSKRA